MLPYFRMMPVFMCADGDATKTRPCTIQEICDSKILKIRLSSPLKTWATDFNMFCDKSIYFGYFGSLYFAGVLFGNFFISKFTDKYGRKPVLVFLLISYLIGSIVTICAWSYYVFFVISFFIGVLYSGTSLCAFVLIFESSSKKRKTTFSTILSTSYGFGAILHIIVFYYFRNWIVSVAVSSVLTIVVLFFTYHLQESPEFFYMKKRYSEMIKVLEYIAISNNQEQNFKRYLATTNIDLMKKEIENNKEYNKNEYKVYGVIDILYLPEQRTVLIIMAFNWFVMTLTFYGINFNVTNFGTNPYLTGVLVYCSEIVAQYLCLYFIIKFGYRVTLSGAYILSACSLILLNIIENQNKIFIEFVLIFFAKFGISAVTNTNYIFTADLFPTIIRVASMSFCSLMSRAGGILGTLIIEISPYSMMSFGMLCLLVAALLFKIDRETQ